MKAIKSILVLMGIAIIALMVRFEVYGANEVSVIALEHAPSYETVFIPPLPETGIVGLEPSYPLPGNSDYRKGVFINGRTVYLTPYSIGKYKVAYRQWKEVYDRAVMHDYKFKNKGREVGAGKDGSEPAKNHDYPVTYVSRYDCIIRCNAYTEMKNGNDAEYCRKKSAADASVLKDVTDMFSCDFAFCSAYVNLGFKPVWRS